MDLYREEILEHWKNPQNFGEIKGADLVIEQVNPLCGDEVTFFFKFSQGPVILNPSNSLRVNSVKNPKRGKRSFADAQDDTVIKDVKFTGNGCAISVATSSMLTEYIKGKSVKAISKLAGKDVLEMIGGNVAPARLKCAFLALEVIKKLESSKI